MRSLLGRSANAALSVLAGLGVLCVVVTLAGVLFDVRALVFTSGSMSPTIETGALGLARPVEAADLEVGDVVSVPVDDSRVTHRITDITREGDRATLVLKGDANTVEDADTYPVDSADRVFFHVPKLGYAVDALSGAVGIFLGGMLAAGLLYLVFRPTRRDTDGGSGRHHTAVLAVLILGVPVVLTAGRVVPTMAAWTDPASAASGGFSAHTVASQAPPTCTNEGGLLGLIGYARLSWTHVDARYEYTWTAIDIANGNQLNSGVITPSGGAGSTATFDVRIGLLDLGLGGKQVDIRVQSRLKSSPSWTARTVTVNRVRTAQLGVGLSVRCGADDRSGPTIGSTAPTNGVTADAIAYQGVVQAACGTNRPACGTVRDDSDVQAVTYQLKRVSGSQTKYFHKGSGWTGNSSFVPMSHLEGAWSIDGLIGTAYVDLNQTMQFTLTVHAVDSAGNASTSTINFTLN